MATGADPGPFQGIDGHLAVGAVGSAAALILDIRLKGRDEVWLAGVRMADAAEAEVAWFVPTPVMTVAVGNVVASAPDGPAFVEELQPGGGHLVQFEFPGGLNGVLQLGNVDSQNWLLSEKNVPGHFTTRQVVGPMV